MPDLADILATSSSTVAEICGMGRPGFLGPMTVLTAMGLVTNGSGGTGHFGAEAIGTGALRAGWNGSGPLLAGCVALHAEGPTSAGRGGSSMDEMGAAGV